MKKLLIAAVAASVALPALAGNPAPVVMEETVIVEETTSSAGGIIIPVLFLLMLLLTMNGSEAQPG